MRSTKPRPSLCPPGLARRPSPWKRWVDSVVNINVPSSRQPHRASQRFGPAPRSAGRRSCVPGAPRSLRSSGSPGRPLPAPPSTAAGRTTAQPNACQSVRLRLVQRPARPRQESPGRRRSRALKRPSRLYRIMGSSRLGAGRVGREKQKQKGLDRVERRRGNPSLLRPTFSAPPQVADFSRIAPSL